jgi:hypothetical protein
LTQPQGPVRLIQEKQDPNLVITGDVACLLVVSGTAPIVAEVTDVRGGFTSAQSLVIETTDSGKISSTPDAFFGFASATPATQLCRPPPFFQTPVLKGEVVEALWLWPSVFAERRGRRGRPGSALRSWW